MVYLCRNNRNGYVKIGFSENPKYREKTLQSEEPDVSFICWFPNLSMDDERILHKEYAEKRLRGEWFDLSDGDIAEIQEYDQCVRPGDRERLKAELIRRVESYVDGWQEQDVAQWSESIQLPEDKVYFLTSQMMQGREWLVRLNARKQIAAAVEDAIEAVVNPPF